MTVKLEIIANKGIILSKNLDYKLDEDSFSLMLLYSGILHIETYNVADDVRTKIKETLTREQLIAVRDICNEAIDNKV